MSRFDRTIRFIKSIYPSQDTIGLHEPRFRGNEKKYLLDTIDSAFVSSVGSYVNQFETMIAKVSQTSKAVALVNGTAGLQVALRLVGVQPGDEVITQSLTFVATANAIIYNGAHPVFVDVDLDTMGLSPFALELFLSTFGEIREDGCYNKATNRRIAACLPMHTFGFPVHIDKLLAVCNKWAIPMVEDAAESLGSEYKSKPIGGFGKVGVFSLNGNKIVTSGGGGAIVSNDIEICNVAKHLTTTAKIPHQYEYSHDMLGYNYRMPNLNASLACAQLEQLQGFLDDKRQLAEEYDAFFSNEGIHFRKEQPHTKANYWLMCVELENQTDRDLFLKSTNNARVMTRPIWQLMTNLSLYKSCQRDDQKNSIFLEERIVNIPSSVR